MRVLVGCEMSGIVRDAFIARGHDAWSCDIQPTEVPGPHFKMSIEQCLVQHQGWDLAIFHPPCTYLSSAGNKWFKPEYADRFPGRHEKRELALDFVAMLLHQQIPRIALENPVGTISGRIRKPDQIIHPYQFGHPVRKATCLWLRNLPKLVPTEIVEPELDTFPSGNRQSKWHTETGHIKCNIERSKARSRTFEGIARAMAEQWGVMKDFSDTWKPATDEEIETLTKNAGLCEYNYQYPTAIRGLIARLKAQLSAVSPDFRDTTKK